MVDEGRGMPGEEEGRYQELGAYATTFNSCQGLTLDRIGADLTRPVFSYGQLYTALSQIRNRQCGMVLLPEEKVNTPNVTYFELLRYTTKYAECHFFLKFELITDGKKIVARGHALFLLCISPWDSFNQRPVSLAILVTQSFLITHVTIWP